MMNSATVPNFHSRSLTRKIRLTGLGALGFVMGLNLLLVGSTLLEILGFNRMQPTAATFGEFALLVAIALVLFFLSHRTARRLEDEEASTRLVEVFGRA